MVGGIQFSAAAVHSVDGRTGTGTKKETPARETVTGRTSHGKKFRIFFRA